MPDLEYHVLCSTRLTAKLEICHHAKRWRLLEYRVLLDQLIVPHLLHTCQGELFSWKSLVTILTLLCALPATS